MSHRFVYRLIYIPCLLGLAALVGLLGHLPRSQGAVKSADMTTYVAADKSFSISYPRTWGTSASTMNGTGARAHLRQSEHAEVIVQCDLMGSTLIDMSRNGTSFDALFSGAHGSGSAPGATTSLPEPNGRSNVAQRSPLESVHALRTGYIMNLLMQYEEQPPAKAVLAGGEALTSAFTARASNLLNPEEVVGRHVTVLAGNRPITLHAYCPKDEAKEFFATFENMLQTLQISEPGG